MLLEQNIIQRGKPLINFTAGIATSSHFHCELLNAREICVDVEIRIICERDRQGRATEVDLLFPSIDGLAKFAIGIRHQFDAIYRGSAITSTRYGSCFSLTYLTPRSIAGRRSAGFTTGPSPCTPNDFAMVAKSIAGSST